MPVRWAGLVRWCDTPWLVVDWEAGMVMIACCAPDVPDVPDVPGVPPAEELLSAAGRETGGAAG